MKIKILNEELNYVVKEVGKIGKEFYAIIVIDNYEKEVEPTFILKRDTTDILIPITKETFDELIKEISKNG